MAVMQIFFLSKMGLKMAYLENALFDPLDFLHGNTAGQDALKVKVSKKSMSADRPNRPTHPNVKGGINLAIIDRSS